MSHYLATKLDMRPLAINAKQQIAGYTSVVAPKAALHGGGVTKVIHQGPAGSESYASAIADDGWVVGHRWDQAAHPLRAFSYSPAGKWTDLQSLFPGAIESMMLDVADEANAVGLYVTPGGDEHPFRLHLATKQWKPLASLPKAYRATPTAVNAAGHAVGYAQQQGGHYFPVVRFGDGAQTPIVLDEPGFAVDVNADGAVVGHTLEGGFWWKAGKLKIYPGFEPHSISDSGAILGEGPAGATLLQGGTWTPLADHVPADWPKISWPHIARKGGAIVGHFQIAGLETKKDPGGFWLAPKPQAGLPVPKPTTVRPPAKSWKILLGGVSSDGGGIQVGPHGGGDPLPPWGLRLRLPDAARTAPARSRADPAKPAEPSADAPVRR